MYFVCTGICIYFGVQYSVMDFCVQFSVKYICVLCVINDLRFLFIVT